MWCNLSKIEFGKPDLRTTRRVSRYELFGVAFVEGYEKTVDFTFESAYLGNLSLTMEDVYQALYVYRLFVKLFENYVDSKPCSKSGNLSKSISRLHIEWCLAETKIEDALLSIEKTMSSEWKNAFKTMFSVYQA